MTRLLSREEVKAFYDRFGVRQDHQFYENRALEALIRHGAFGEARSVFELGCGTGRLAVRLLREVLPADAAYLGVDLSETMVRLATERLAPWGDRARVRLADGIGEPPAADEPFDRFLSTYVLDLLSDEAVHAVLATAYRSLTPGGKLVLASLTEGTGGLSDLVCWVWRRIHALRPQWVGGCRPIRLLPFLPAEAWRIDHHEVVPAFAVRSEVVVATPRKGE